MSLGDVEITYYNSYEENERTEIKKNAARTFCMEVIQLKTKKTLHIFFVL